MKAPRPLAFIKHSSARHLTIASLVLAGCGVQQPELKELRSGEVKKVRFEDFSQGLNLKDEGESETTYEGSILMWHADVSSSGVARVLQQGKEIKAADRTYKQAKFLIDPLFERNEAINKRLKDIDKELTSGSEIKINEFYAEQGPRLQKSAREWFAANFNSAQEAGFHQHCEALVWRFALSDVLNKHYPWRERPSPSVFCEEYYQKQGLFTAPACKQDDGVLSKDYFDCFWGESGVFKTNLKYIKKPKGQPDEAPSEQEIARAKEALRAWAIKAKQFDFDEFYDNPVLRKDSNGAIFKDEQGRIYTIKFQLHEGEFKKLASLPLTTFLKGDAPQEVNQLFAMRGAKTGKTKLSFHDRFFTYHLIDRAALPEDRRSLPELAFKDQDLQILQDLSTYPAEVFGAKLPNFAGQVEDLQKEKERLNKELPELTEKRLALESVLDIKAKKAAWMQVRGEAADYILDKQLVEALYPRVLVKVKKNNNLVQVDMNFDYVNPVRKAQGCFDVQRQVQVACSNDSAASFAPLHVHLDVKTGKLELQLPLDNPAALGFTPKTSHEDRPAFQLWRSEDLAGKQLVFKLYPRRYDATLTLLTGKVFLYADHQEQAQGSVTLTQHGPFSTLLSESL